MTFGIFIHMLAYLVDLNVQHSWTAAMMNNKVVINSKRAGAVIPIKVHRTLP